jgi:hypothetical protein
MAALGCGMWAVMIAVMVFGKKAEPDDGACRECGHEAGLDGSHCADEIPDDGGWRQPETCRCQNDYHWNFESAYR